MGNFREDKDARSSGGLNFFKYKRIYKKCGFYLQLRRRSAVHAHSVRSDDESRQQSGPWLTSYPPPTIFYFLFK